LTCSFIDGLDNSFVVDCYDRAAGGELALLPLLHGVKIHAPQGANDDKGETQKSNELGGGRAALGLFSFLLLAIQHPKTVFFFVYNRFP